MDHVYGVAMLQSILCDLEDVIPPTYSQIFPEDPDT